MANEFQITRTVEAYARRQEQLWIRLFNQLSKADQKIAAERMQSKATGALYNKHGREIDENAAMLRNETNRGKAYQRRREAGI
jgi:hypothetical protein